MSFLNRKINRYKLPPFIVLLVLVMDLAMLFRTRLENSRVLYTIFFTWILVMIVYFIFVATVCRSIKNDLVAILISAGVSILVVSRMYTIMHWPGANTLLITGVAAFLIALFLFLLLKLKGKQLV